MAIVTVAMMGVFAACGGSADTNTPDAAVKAAIECVQNGDYEGYLELMQLEEKDGKSVDERRKELLPLLEAKLKEDLEKKEGIKSYEIVETTIAEDGKTAKVKSVIVYGNGKEKKDTHKLVLTDDGKWLIDAGK